MVSNSAAMREGNFILFTFYLSRLHCIDIKSLTKLTPAAVLVPLGPDVVAIGGCSDQSAELYDTARDEWLLLGPLRWEGSCLADAIRHCAKVKAHQPLQA